MPRSLVVVGLLVAVGLAGVFWYSTARVQDVDSPPHGDAPSKDVPFDPVVHYGPIFTDWTAPQLAIVFTGQQDGYLEPCGCAGLDRMKGGLARRHALIRQLEADGWPVVSFDNGGLVRRFGQQAEIKLEYAAQALRTLNYSAVGLGEGELQLSASALLVAIDDPETTPFVSANVGVFGLDAETTPKSRVIEKAGKRIGVTSVLGDRFREELNNADIETLPATDALKRIVDELAEECDVLVLMSHAPREESIALAEAFPQFDFVVTAGGAEEPPPEAELIGDGSTMLIEVGHKGMYAAVVGLYDDPDAADRYQRVTLDSRFEDTAEMKQMMRDYQTALEVQGLDRLVGSPRKHPRSEGEGDLAGQFVGSTRCGECHTAAYAKWSSTGHSHATESLVKSNPPRQFDPECLSCHTTGWHPQDYVPYVNGYEGLDATPLLVGNGCENCHGPGGAHVAAEEARPVDLQLREIWRNRMRLPLGIAEEQTCFQCHDLDNSPSFDFKTYYPKIEHRGTK